MERVFSSELPHRRVLVVADDATSGDRLRDMFADDRTIVVVASSDEAVERLGMGEACDLVVVDADDEGAIELRDRLAEVAPDVVMRTFEVCTHASQAPRANESQTQLRSRLDASGIRRDASGMWSVAAR
jgi:CheY-like chemotaxis protein